MTGNSAPIINADEVEVFAGNIQTDEDKSLDDAITANSVVVSDNRILQDASLVGTKKAYQTPNSVLTLNMSLSNNGAEADVYTLKVTDSAGWQISGLPEEVDLAALTSVDLVLNITLSQNIGETDAITVTATSKSNPEVVTTMQFQVTVIGEDENVVAVDQNQLQNLIAENKVSTGSSGGVGLAACPSSGDITFSCISSSGQILINVNIANGVMVSQAQLGGMINNAGVISQATIQEGTTLQGGKLTGYIQNNGTLMNIEFVGAVLTGGVLGGEILNTSQANGVLEDVSFAANTKVRGGKLRGKITGDINAPTLLENLEVEAGAVLTGVIIGDGVKLPADATLGKGVRLNARLPDASGTSLTISPLGEFGEAQAHFFGGTALSASIDINDFLIEREVTADQNILYAANVQVDPAHVGKKADLLLVIGVEQPPAPYDGGVGTIYVALDENLQAVEVNLYAEPSVWMAQLTEPIVSDVTLEETMAINVWHGALGMVSKHYAFTGYRLHEDNTIVFSAQPITVEVVE
jgi:hypothetical protein